jgi:hypothetical protein
MRAIALTTAMAVALVAAPAASAKGSAPERVCGESGCVRIQDYPRVVLVLYRGAARPQPPRLPFYLIHYRAPGVPPHYFVPALNLVGADFSGGRRWFRLEEPALGAIRAAIRGLDPFRAPESWAIRSRDRADSPTRKLSAALLLIALATCAVVALHYRNERVPRGVEAA